MSFILSQCCQLFSVSYNIRNTLKKLKCLSNLDDTNSDSEPAVSNLKEILIFWILFGLVKYFEVYLEFVISWFPCYYYIKSLFWLLIAFPKMRIGNAIFHKVLIPFLNELNKNADENILPQLIFAAPFILFDCVFPCSEVDEGFPAGIDENDESEQFQEFGKSKGENLFQRKLLSAARRCSLDFILPKKLARKSLSPKPSSNSLKKTNSPSFPKTNSDISLTSTPSRRSSRLSGGRVDFEEIPQEGLRNRKKLSEKFQQEHQQQEQQDNGESSGDESDDSMQKTFMYMEDDEEDEAKEFLGENVTSAEDMNVFCSVTALFNTDITSTPASSSYRRMRRQTMSNSLHESGKLRRRSVESVPTKSLFTPRSFKLERNDENNENIDINSLHTSTSISTENDVDKSVDDALFAGRVSVGRRRSAQKMRRSSGRRSSANYSEAD